MIETMTGGLDSEGRMALVRRKRVQARRAIERATTMERLLAECLDSSCLTLDAEELLDACLRLAADGEGADARP